MSDGEIKQTLPPRVFISYAQYEPAHSERVLALAHALAGDGLDVELDQFHGHETVDWPRWCAEHLKPENSDFVLMVCSAEYRRRIEGQVEIDEGRGVFWEGNLIYGYLYRAKANERFVPLLLDDEPESSLPPAVANWNQFCLRDFGLQSADQGYEDLYRLLTDQPATRKPERGALVRLRPRPVPEVRGKTPGAPTKPAPTANETATGGTRQASPVPHPTKIHTEHQSLATWVFGGLLLAFLFAVFTFAPEPLPDYKHRILALCAALLAGLFGWFLSGEIGLRIEALKSRFGGLAMFVVVLVWWLSPLAPVEPEKAERREARGTESATVGTGVANTGRQTIDGPVAITGGGSSPPREELAKPGSGSAGTGIANTGNQVSEGPVTIGGAPRETK